MKLNKITLFVRNYQPVVDGKWEVVSGGRAAVVSTPSQGAGSKATGLRDEARENHFLFGFWGRALSSLKY